MASIRKELGCSSSRLGVHIMDFAFGVEDETEKALHDILFIIIKIMLAVTFIQTIVWAK